MAVLAGWLDLHTCGARPVLDGWQLGGAISGHVADGNNNVPHRGDLGRSRLVSHQQWLRVALVVRWEPQFAVPAVMRVVEHSHAVGTQWVTVAVAGLIHNVAATLR
jgi:hypothetical protein